MQLVFIMITHILDSISCKDTNKSAQSVEKNTYKFIIEIKNTESHTTPTADASLRKENF
jgi:hypothetical protein